MRTFNLQLRSVAICALALTAFFPASAFAKPGACDIVNQTQGGKYTSLQAAVDDAAEGNTLKLKGVCYGTTIIDKDLSIRGNSNPGYGAATLHGQDLGTVLTVDHADVVLDAVTITHGTGQIIPNTDSRLWGGGIFNNEGTVSLISSTVTENTAFEGAGIFNDGYLILIGSDVSNNNGDFGAGINSQGQIAIIRSTLTDNNAPGDGGAIFSWGGTGMWITVTDSTISGNYAGWGDGGGICSYYGPLTVTNSTLSDNTAEGYGGGIFFYGDPAPLTVVDSTITGNTVVWGDGGGVYISGGAATFTNTTFSDNDPNHCAGTGCPQ